MAQHCCRRVVQDDLGQDLIEYALLLTFVAIAVVVGVHSLGIGITGKYTDASTAISAAGSAGETDGANPNPGEGRPGSGNPGGGNPGGNPVAGNPGGGNPGGNPGGGNPGGKKP